HIYSRDDCTFRERILPDGYNVYVSDSHGALLSLGNHRQRSQGRDRGAPSLAQFLPRVSILDQASSSGLDVPDQPGQSAVQLEEPLDTMDSFGKLSQIIHSPSFHKR
ncbi:fibroblast growth factor 19-like, partial [Plectropomus leopardus]|uniref:fibroblast growth factor 19-like n=1 Tax=Plectropomus leopardus TaxID=160734 RepID=UPI001C4C0415